MEFKNKIVFFPLLELSLLVINSLTILSLRDLVLKLIFLFFIKSILFSISKTKGIPKKFPFKSNKFNFFSSSKNKFPLSILIIVIISSELS